MLRFISVLHELSVHGFCERSLLEQHDRDEVRSDNISITSENIKIR